MITWIMFDCYNIAIIRQRVSKLIQSEQCRRSGKLRRCHSEDLSCSPFVDETPECLFGSRVLPYLAPSGRPLKNAAALGRRPGRRTFLFLMMAITASQRRCFPAERDTFTERLRGGIAAKAANLGPSRCQFSGREKRYWKFSFFDLRLNLLSFHSPKSS
ncbi:hypothetical protein MTP99_008688 [Tenebrio molitor]|nr:hypothetical protein MTP99_008688 [Tenebrio molitor]